MSRPIPDSQCKHLHMTALNSLINEKAKIKINHHLFSFIEAFLAPKTFKEIIQMEKRHLVACNKHNI